MAAAKISSSGLVDASRRYMRYIIRRYRRSPASGRGGGGGGSCEPARASPLQPPSSFASIRRAPVQRAAATRAAVRGRRGAVALAVWRPLRLATKVVRRGGLPGRRAGGIGGGGGRHVAHRRRPTSPPRARRAAECREYHSRQSFAYRRRRRCRLFVVVVRQSVRSTVVRFRHNIITHTHTHIHAHDASAFYPPAAADI